MDISPAYDPQNLFAMILRKERDAEIIFETEHSMAILDAFPCTTGHALLLPKAEAVSIAELEKLPVETLGHIMKDLTRLNRIVREGMKATATNVLTNSYPDSGQAVPHVHFHVIPRNTGDGVIKHPHSATCKIPSTVASELIEAMRAVDN